MKHKILFTIVLSIILNGCASSGNLTNNANININKHGVTFNLGGYYNQAIKY